MARCNCNNGTHPNHHGSHCNRPAQTRDGLCEDCAAKNTPETEAGKKTATSHPLFYRRGAKTKPTR
jgi:NMD protein affecting ribosome stability and mRNA decay